MEDVEGGREHIAEGGCARRKGEGIISWP